MNQHANQLTLRLSAPVMAVINERRGQQSAASFIKNMIADCISNEQREQQIIAAIERSRKDVLTAIKSLVAE